MVSPRLTTLADQFVQHNGLSMLFGFIMSERKQSKNVQKIFVRLSASDQIDDEQAAVSILLTLLLNCTGENLDRVLYKLIENSFEKLTRLYKNIFERWLQPMAEYDLRLFKSAEEVNYLRADFPQFDLLVTTSIVLLFICK